MRELSAVKSKSELYSKWMEILYSTYSEYYDLFFNKILQQGREEGVRSLEIKRGGRILEIGIGTGLSIPFYPEHCSLTGIDISAEMLRKAMQKLRQNGALHVTLKKMDASKLHFEDESFDGILVPYLISVVPEPQKVVSEINRVCRQGGIVVFVNHFHSSNQLLAFVEKTLSPISRFLGFRLDLPIESVLETDLFEIKRIERVNMFGLWSLVKLKKRIYQ